MTLYYQHLPFKNITDIGYVSVVVNPYFHRGFLGRSNLGVGVRLTTMVNISPEPHITIEIWGITVKLTELHTLM